MPESVEQFAARIKSAYPQYAQVDDYELVGRILKKYPKYAQAITSSAGQLPNPTVDRPAIPTDLAEGAFKGLVSTAHGAFEMMPDWFADPNSPAMKEMGEYSESANLPQSIGKGVEQVGEFFVPGGAVKKGGKLAEELVKGGKAAKYTYGLVKGERAAKVAGVLGRAATASGVSAGVEAVHGGDPVKAAIAAPIADLSVEAALPVLGKLKGAVPFLRDQQSKLHDVALMTQHRVNTARTVVQQSLSKEFSDIGRAVDSANPYGVVSADEVKNIINKNIGDYSRVDIANVPQAVRKILSTDAENLSFGDLAEMHQQLGRAAYESRNLSPGLKTALKKTYTQTSRLMEDIADETQDGLGKRLQEVNKGYTNLYYDFSKRNLGKVIQGRTASEILKPFSGEGWEATRRQLGKYRKYGLTPEEFKPAGEAFDKIKNRPFAKTLLLSGLKHAAGGGIVGAGVSTLTGDDPITGGIIGGVLGVGSGTVGKAMRLAQAKNALREAAPLAEVVRPLEDAAGEIGVTRYQSREMPMGTKAVGPAGFADFGQPEQYMFNEGTGDTFSAPLEHNYLPGSIRENMLAHKAPVAYAKPNASGPDFFPSFKSMKGFHDTPYMKEFERGLKPVEGEGVSSNGAKRAFGVYMGTREPSYLVPVKGDIENIFAYAARRGNEISPITKSSQESVAIFLDNAKGKGVRYEMGGVADPDAVVDAMSKRDITGGTIVGKKLVIYDPDGSQGQKVAQLAKDLNLSQPAAKRGKIVFMGSDKFADYAKRAYKKSASKSVEAGEKKETAGEIIFGKLAEHVVADKLKEGGETIGQHLGRTSGLLSGSQPSMQFNEPTDSRYRLYRGNVIE